MNPSRDAGGPAGSAGLTLQGLADNDGTELTALLTRCARSDAAALRDLYVSEAPRLLGLLMRMLRHRDQAEDALQDVFCQIWQRAAQYDPGRGHPLAWMQSMARYRAIDLLRSRRTLEPLGDDDELASAAAASQETLTDGGDEHAAGFAAGALDRCFDRLSENQQRCIRLAYFRGLTHEEVAGAVQSPLGTVKSWIRRALDSLRECMSP